MKWEAIKDKTDKELKEIAMHLYNNTIFTNLHLKPHEVSMHFYPLLFGGPQQPFDGKDDNNDVGKLRENKIWKILDEDEERRAYREDYLGSIGMVYEFFGQELPRYMNGKPIFTSCFMVNHGDTDKILEFHKTYKELREKTDNF
jgi:hypothetical protein